LGNRPESEGERPAGHECVVRRCSTAGTPAGHALLIGARKRMRRRHFLSFAFFLAIAQSAASAPLLRPFSFNAVERFADIESRLERSNAVHLAGADKVRTLIARHREAIEACTTHPLFANAVNRLIDDIGLSHFHYYADNDWQYWHLRSAFLDHSDAGHVEHVGIIPERIENRWFIRGILEGSPADKMRLEVGDELLTVDGLPYSPVNALRGTAGETVTLRLRRRPAVSYEVIVAPKKESLYAALQRAMRKSIRTIRHEEHVFAYLHGWTLLGSGAEYTKLLRMQDDVDGLLLDYRDGFGGTWHRAEHFLLGQDGRNLAADDATWTKPLVILTGDGTRSAKEIVVYHVKEAGRAPLVGEPTPGHVISVGGVVPIGDDGLLMLPGLRFHQEGKPIVPDFLVRRDIRYCGGADLQLEFAKGLLGSLIRRENQGIVGSWDDAALAMPNVAQAP